MTARLLAALVILGFGVACSDPTHDPPPPAIGPLPGAESFSSKLQAELAAALAAKGAAYHPHTRHLRPDGTPRYTNRLILESSPYLLQHAHNPVNWYPWGDEAFAHAARESKPVLLSVGYSTCHWCHVMEDESFEDEEIATYLNQHYVAIKVDREVRPDVDDVYMSVVQMLTGSGGWPMTVWLTPERQPFSGGTYFPPRQFLSALQQLRQAFDVEPFRVAEQAGEITRRLQQSAERPGGEALPDATVLRRAFDGFATTFDGANGGFGRAPKFPRPPDLELLLRYHRHVASARALDMVTLTLEKMAAGGIHDHVGGGFHRYATDATWQVPHFEKMLYDNAQLAAVYLAAYQVTKRDEFADMTRDILDYVGREMTAPEGGFYAATDADSEGAEGKFFVWTPAEVRAALDGPHADVVLADYGVTDKGDFHGKNILHVTAPLPEVASKLGLEPTRLRQLLDEARAELYAVRARRVAPHKDTNILAAWNGLMISAFARAGSVLGNPGYIGRATAAARFALERMRADGRLRRSFAGGTAHEEAFLDDYAFVAAGLLDLYEATFELRWLREAIALQDVLVRDFSDADKGGFFLTGARREVTLSRQKPYYDGATPSGNAVAALNMLRLAEFTADDRWRGRAEATLRTFALILQRTPGAAPALLAALDFRLDRPKEIVIISPAGQTDGSRPLLNTVHAAYVPNHVLTVTTEGEEQARQRSLIPLVAEKLALHGTATAYVCEQKVCSLPTSDPAVLAAQLAKVHPLE
ncbi:MAG: thioredoxin domain-containing protein [Candidatus Binatia bacterium]